MVVSYSTDLMQCRSFLRVRAQGQASPIGTTLVLERYHTRARAVPHESSCTFTLESTYCYTQCHSPHANTVFAFFRFSQLKTCTIESSSYNICVCVAICMGLLLDF